MDTDDADSEVETHASPGNKELSKPLLESREDINAFLSVHDTYDDYCDVPGAFLVQSVESGQPCAPILWISACSLPYALCSVVYSLGCGSLFRSRLAQERPKNGFCTVTEHCRCNERLLGLPPDTDTKKLSLRLLRLVRRQI